MALRWNFRPDGASRSEILVNIELTADQALVLSDWMNGVMHREDFSVFVDDRAAWSALFRISGVLQTQLASIFDLSYSEKLNAAR
jgi:hypothetical protein